MRKSRNERNDAKRCMTTCTIRVRPGGREGDGRRGVCGLEHLTTVLRMDGSDSRLKKLTTHIAIKRDSDLAFRRNVNRSTGAHTPLNLP